MEQNTKIPGSFEGYLANILPDDQAVEAWNARIERWRAEDGERGAP